MNLSILIRGSSKERWSPEIRPDQNFEDR